MFIRIKGWCKSRQQTACSCWVQARKLGASIPLDFPAAANQQQRSAAWLAALDALDLVCLRTAALDVVLEGVSDSTRQGVGLPQKSCSEVLTETGCRHFWLAVGQHVHTLGCTLSHECLMTAGLVMSLHALPPRCLTQSYQTHLAATLAEPSLQQPLPTSSCQSPSARGGVCLCRASCNAHQGHIPCIKEERQEVG